LSSHLDDVDNTLLQYEEKTNNVDPTHLNLTPLKFNNIIYQQFKHIALVMFNLQ